MFTPITLWAVATFALIMNHRANTRAKNNPPRQTAERLPRGQGWTVSFLMSSVLWVGIIYGAYKLHSALQ